VIFNVIVRLMISLPGAMPVIEREASKALYLTAELRQPAQLVEDKLFEGIVEHG